MKATRLFIYAAVLLFGLLLVKRASSLNGSTDDLANLAGQFVPLLILCVAGIITYQARIRGASQGLAFGIPLAIQAIIAFGLVGPGLGRLVFLFMLVPMVVVCGLVVMLVKPRGQKAVPKPAQNPSPERNVTSSAMPTGKPNRLAGWVMMVLGGLGIYYFMNIILYRRHSYGLLGEEDYTLEDNIRSVGRLVLISIFFMITGLGVICGWRWVKPWVVVLVSLAIFWLWDLTYLMKWPN